MLFLQLPDQVCQTLTFSSNLPLDTVIFTFRAWHFFPPDLCKANAATLSCARLNLSETNSNKTIKTRTSKIRWNRMLFLGFLRSLWDYSVTPGTFVEETPINPNCSCEWKSNMYRWENSSSLGPLGMGDSSEPASKEPLVFIIRCWKLDSRCHAHLLPILV